MLGAARTVGSALAVPRGDTREILYHSTPVSWIRAHTEPPYFRSDRDGEKVPTGFEQIAANVGDIGISSLHPDQHIFLYLVAFPYRIATT